MTDDQLKEDAIREAELVYFYKTTAQLIGVSEDTLKRMRDADTVFADRLDQARARFIRRQEEKAKPEFLLERTERELFAPPAQKVKVEHENILKVILEEYGLGGKSVGETEAIEERPPQEPASD